MDLLTFSPQLKLTKLVELRDDPKRLVEYMRKFLVPLVYFCLAQSLPIVTYVVLP